jgi:hypothetical protein
VHGAGGDADDRDPMFGELDARRPGQHPHAALGLESV